MSGGRPAWAETPYVRIYSSIPRDYPDVWHDASALGTYVQLLHLADGQYPAPPPLPRRIDERSLGVLVTAGLIRVRDDDTFEVAGLRAEREGRVSGRRAGGLARAAVAERGNDGRFRTDPGDGGPDAGNAGNAGSDAGPAGSWPVAGVQHDQVSRAEPSRAEPSRTREADDGRKDLEAWLLVRSRPPTERQRAFLDRYVRVFDSTGPERAERLILANPTDPIAALQADLDTFLAQRREEASKAEAPKPRPRRKGSGLTGINAELSKILGAKYATEEADFRAKLDGADGAPTSSGGGEPERVGGSR